MPKVPGFGLAVCAVIGGFAVIQFGEVLFPAPFAGETFIEFMIGCCIGATARYLFALASPASRRREIEKLGGAEERGP